MSFFRKPLQANKNSSFWLDLDSMSNRAYDVLTGKTKKSSDFVKMISIRNSIANFVRIVTGQNIPVKYSSGQQSYTDGKTVVLSAQIDNDNFDPTVGLALHEASHILLTDFSTLPRLIAKPPVALIKRVMAERKLDIDNATKYVQKNLKDLINIIEDRRIDNYIFTNAPGYKGYYHALYEKYFNNPMIDKGLKSNEFRLETWDSYTFRIGNFTNPNRDLNALKGLQKIWDMIDIKNIGRINNTKEVVQMAEEVFNVIEDNVTNEATQQQEQDSKKSQKDKNSGGAASGKGKGKKEKADKDDDKNLDPTGSDDSEKGDEDQNDEDSDEEGQDDTDTDNQGVSDAPGEPVELNDKEMAALKEAMKKQQQFNSGEITKTAMRSDEQSKMEAIEKADASYANVAKDISRDKIDGCRVLVAKKLTEQLIKSKVFGHTLTSHKNSDYHEAVLKGMRMGAMLGKKLQVRQEARDTKFTRQNVGRIDRRLIASIGTGLENIFEQTFVSKYNPSIVHISIDASGSMGGNRFEKALTCAVAIAKACSMIENLNCVISFRSTEISGGEEIPAVLIGYDSRIDSINKITNLFGHIAAATSTPEGLCFEAIMKLIPSGGAALNSYFINFSDGEPGFSNTSVSYHGDAALDHTKKQVQKIREKNIKVLSYFIGRTGHKHSGFAHMYGKDAFFIDTDSVPAVAKTMNAKFLEA
jgi:hypothetical protein